MTPQGDDGVTLMRRGYHFRVVYGENAVAVTIRYG